ncbi:hypothetical protein TI04_12930 [Achromatium sp. WMS2]|nr:hypothetical protein TI04_12930 [Achromatium sp. WMS2]
MQNAIGSIIAAIVIYLILPSSNPTPYPPKANIIFVFDHSIRSYEGNAQLFSSAKQSAVGFIHGIDQDQRLSLILIHGQRMSIINERDKLQRWIEEAYQNDGQFDLPSTVAKACELAANSPAKIVILTASQVNSHGVHVLLKSIHGCNQMRFYLVFLTAEPEENMDTEVKLALNSFATASGGEFIQITSNVAVTRLAILAQHMK